MPHSRPDCASKLSIRLIRFICMGILFLPPGAHAAKSLVWEEHEVRKYGESVEIAVDGEIQRYYTVGPDMPLEIRVKGPRKLLILIRNVAPKRAEFASEYRINVLMDERNFDEFSFRSNLSDRAALTQAPQDFVVGQVNKFVLEIPDGQHRVKLFLPQSMNKQKLFARFFLSEILAKDEKRMAMSPDAYYAVVNLIYKEREYTYYRMTRKHPLQLAVIGPTELKVITRLEFNHRMKGKNLYQIQVYEDDQLIQTRQYRTYKSDAASYRKVTNVTPGRSRSFFITVPDGKHIYRIVPVVLKNQSVIAKILIPQKDIGVMKE